MKHSAVVGIKSTFTFQFVKSCQCYLVVEFNEWDFLLYGSIFNAGYSCSLGLILLTW